MTAIARRKGYGGFRAISRQNVTRTREWALIPPDLQEAVQIVSLVLPFRTNEYVMRELIDWSNIDQRDPDVYQPTSRGADDPQRPHSPREEP
jgi:hypothetical protein